MDYIEFEPPFFKARTCWLEETPICCAAATSEALLEIDINNVLQCPRHLSPRYARPIGIRYADKRFEFCVVDYLNP